MTDLTPASRWCPSCGDEYEPRIEQCVDCGIPLEDRKPDVLRPVNAAEEPEMTVIEPALRFDLAEWISEEREDLIEYLEEVPIPFLWVDQDTIEAAPGYEEELTEAVNGTERAKPFATLRSAVRLDGEPLSLGRRGAAAGVDLLAAGLPAWAASIALDDAGLVALVVLALLVLNQVVGLGERGRSIGKTIVGARLRSTDGRSLSAVEAGVRWLMRDGPLLLAIGIALRIEEPGGVFLAMEATGALCSLAVVASVVFEQQHRGLHEQLVESAVLNADSITSTDLIS